MRIFTPVVRRKGGRAPYRNEALTDAQSDLAGRHASLARKMAWRMTKRRPGLFDEIMSAAFLGLIHAARSYDADRGSFGPYASNRIRGEILEAIERENFHTQGGPSEEIDVPEDDQGPDEFDDIVASLDPRERELITLRYQQGLSQGEAAERLGYSRSWIGQLERAALCRLREREGRWSA